MATQTYYEILGVSPHADLPEIKRAYRRLARQYHPDVNPDDDAVGMFQRLTDIYHVLLDPVERRRYDQMLTTSDMVFVEDAVDELEDTALDLYQRALARSQRGHYRDAIVIYSQALSLDPQYVDAYAQRGFAYHSLKNYPAALADYSAALGINLHLAPVHFYRGLTRFDLGDTNAAIRDFTSALELDASYAKAYYRRGLAYADLGDRRAAAVDLRQAVKSFKEQGQQRQSREASAALKQVDGWFVWRLLHVAPLLPLRDVALVARRCVTPVSGLLPAFVRLGRQRAIATGLLLGLWFALCLAVQIGPVLALSLRLALALLPLASITLANALGRSLLGGYSSLAGDIFTAGTALLPLSGAVLALALPLPVFVAVTAVAVSYGALVLYSCCSQIANLAEGKAALLAAGLLLAGLLPVLWILGLV
ncbi:MAG: DnaJ domain-containing protein [Cyanobacteria bacterium P01_A01_bin.135]